jgi:hypothetical protein
VIRERSFCGGQVAPACFGGDAAGRQLDRPPASTAIAASRPCARRHMTGDHIPVKPHDRPSTRPPRDREMEAVLLLERREPSPSAASSRCLPAGTRR